MVERERRCDIIRPDRSGPDDALTTIADVDLSGPRQPEAVRDGRIRGRIVSITNNIRKRTGISGRDDGKCVRRKEDVRYASRVCASAKIEC